MTNQVKTPIQSSKMQQLTSLFEPLTLDEKVEVCRRFQHITNKGKSALLQQAIRETKLGAHQIGD